MSRKESLRQPCAALRPNESIRYALIVLLAILLASVPAKRAIAAPSAGQTITVRNGATISAGKYGHRVRFHTAPDGSVLYCIQMYRDGGGNTIQTKVSSDKATAEVGYVLYHGYPATRTINGRTWSADEARAITQFAIWIFTDCGGDLKTTSFADLQSTYRAPVNALVNSAKSWAKSSANTAWAPENNYGLKCYPVQSGMQGMVLVTGVLTGTPTLKKSSTEPSLTSGNPAYSLEGAAYSVLKADGSGTGTYFYVGANGSGTLRTWNGGTSPSASDGKASLPAGSYRIKELVAPRGYRLDTNTYTLNVVGLQSNSINVSDAPLKNGILSLRKVSSTPSVTEDNPCYSLEGARYGVYSDNRCTSLVGTLVTDASGSSADLELSEGTYWIKELEASPGYLLDQEAHQVSVGVGTPCVVELDEVPDLAPVGVAVRKVDADQKTPIPQGNASLSGAEFTVRYYAGAYEQDELPETSTRSWVLRTDENGEATFDEAHKVSGDAFYLTGEGIAAMPLGTVSISETREPKGYRIVDDAHCIRRIRYNDGSSSGETRLAPLEVSEEVLRGGVKVLKANEDGEGLAGAQFDITNVSSKSVVVGGTSYEPGEFCLTITSGDDGIATTDSHALPFGTYSVSERVAPRGYLANGDWKADVNIGSDGVVEDLTGESCVDRRMTIEVPLSARKLFDGDSQGRQLEEGMFSFSLADEQGTVLQTKTNDSEGNVRFDPLVFDLSSVGSHAYTITEVAGNDEEIVYDAHEERVTVTIGEQDDGTLSSQVSTDEDGIVFANKTVDALPMPLTGKRGLSDHLVGIASILSCAGTLALRRAGKRPRA